MVKHRAVPSVIGEALVLLILGLLSVIMLYPMLHQIFVSFSDPALLFKHRGLMFWPQGLDLTAYSIVLRNGKILSGYVNTLFVIAVGLVFNLVLTALGAYFLSRKNVMFYRPIMLIIVITMYFSGGLVPFWLTVRNLGMYNSLWALIIPSAITTYNMILLRSYFSSIPDSLMESVFIDGGGHMVTLFQIVLPISLPAMAVMVLYYGVGHWNSWFNAMIFLRSEEKFPLQLVLRLLLIQGSAVDVDKGMGALYEQIQESVKAATVVVSTVPILLIYPFLQKYFVGGLMIGSLKE